MEQNKTSGKVAEKMASAIVPTRGKVFEGTVVSDRMRGTVVIEFPRVIKSRKYNRFFRRTTRMKARVPEGLSVKTGDRVQISETRRFAKTVNFIVTKKLE